MLHYQAGNIFILQQHDYSYILVLNINQLIARQMKVTLLNILANKKISLREAEKKIGLGKSTLHRIANEESSPTLEELEMIAKGLNIKITDMFESDYK